MVGFGVLEGRGWGGGGSGTRKKLAGWQLEHGVLVVESRGQDVGVANSWWSGRGRAKQGGAVQALGGQMYKTHAHDWNSPEAATRVP